MNSFVWILVVILGLVVVFAGLVMVGRIDILIVLAFGMVIGYYVRMRQKAGKE